MLTAEVPLFGVDDGGAGAISCDGVSTKSAKKREKEETGAKKYISANAETIDPMWSVRRQLKTLT